MTHDTDSTTFGTETQKNTAGTYHTVCMDCTAEAVHHDEHTAETLAEGHRERHGHTVKVEDIDR